MFDRWTEEFLTKRCIGYDRRGRLKWVGLDYDPIIDYVVAQLEAAVSLGRAMERYAGQDAQRWLHR
ncbi:MAG: hypothetical protein ACREQR_09700 [Candidatus Binataceae bacterium]